MYYDISLVVAKTRVGYYHFFLYGKEKGGALLSFLYFKDRDRGGGVILGVFTRHAADGKDSPAYGAGKSLPTRQRDESTERARHRIELQKV